MKEFDLLHRHYTVEKTGYGQYVAKHKSQAVHFTDSYVYDTIDADPYLLAMQRNCSVTYAKHLISMARKFIHNLVKSA